MLTVIPFSCITFLVASTLAISSEVFKERNHLLTQESCNLSLQLIAEIHSYQSIATRIMDTAINGDFKGRTYDELAKFVDKHINRLTGTPELEASIDYMMTKMMMDGLVNVRGEDVTVPRWIR